MGLIDKERVNCDQVWFAQKEARKKVCLEREASLKATFESLESKFSEDLSFIIGLA